MSLGLDRRTASWDLVHSVDDRPRVVRLGPFRPMAATQRTSMPDARAVPSAGAHSWVRCGEPLAGSAVDIPVHRHEPAISHRCRGATLEALRHRGGRELGAMAVRMRPAAQARRHGRDGGSHSIVAAGRRCGRRAAPKGHRPGAARRDERSRVRAGVGRVRLPLSMRLDASVGEQQCRPHVFSHEASGSFSLSRLCLRPAAHAPHSRSGPLP